ncbi:MAG: cysteine-rich CWC family protein [Planctomycetes bacterium]|nr:cysteine-rich CWC family protein [Planctomycetota bacterium]
MTAIDPQRCPLCSGPNACALAAGTGACSGCWCADVHVPGALLARVPTAAVGVACICRTCIDRARDATAAAGSDAAMPTFPPGLEAVQDPGGRDALRLHGPGGTILVALLGAQVLSCRTSVGELLFTGSTAEHAKGKPVRGGIPLVFPWFGDHPTDPKLPAHGFARTQAWRVAETGAGPSVVLETTDDASTRALWPHAYRLRLSISVATQPTLRWEIENRGDAPFRCEEALHTYFAVGDVHTATVHGLQGVPHTETAKEPEGPWDVRAPLRFRAETDRVFHGTPDTIELHAPALRRTVTLASRNARSAIVWTPWPTKAARLSGLGPDDWQRFCCIETANCKQDALQLAPGQRHVLELVLRAAAN